MEVYFKELISEEASLEKLISDLERVVQGADDFAKAMGVNLTENSGREIAHRLRRLRESCLHLKSQITAKARATDRLVRRRPYIFLGGAMLLGFVVGLSLASEK